MIATLLGVAGPGQIMLRRGCGVGSGGSRSVWCWWKCARVGLGRWTSLIV